MMICDSHCDTLYKRLLHPDSPCDVTVERLKKGRVGIQTMAMYVGNDPSPEVVRQRAEGMYALLPTLEKEGIRQITDLSQAGGEPALLLSVEGCELFEGGLSEIDLWYDRGVRMAAVCWNFQNKLGTPAVLGADVGLTAYGLKAVRHMQEKHMAVDVSHLNEQGFYDIIDETDAPPLASHSCCAALCKHPRNLTDRQIKVLIACEGYIGVNFYPSFLKEDGACGVEDIVRHIDHICQLGGAESVGFGSDFDGIECKPKGVEGPEAFLFVLAALKKRGYNDRALRNIAGLNFMSYFKRI